MGGREEQSASLAQEETTNQQLKPIEPYCFYHVHAVFISHATAFKYLKFNIIIVNFFYRYGRERRNAALAHLAANINSRDVRGGHFELPIDPKGNLGDLSLNKSQAYTILAPSEDFKDKHYNHILDNVSSGVYLQCDYSNLTTS